MYDKPQISSGDVYLIRTQRPGRKNFLLVGCLPLFGLEGGGGGRHVSGEWLVGRQVLQTPLSLINLSSSLWDGPPWPPETWWMSLQGPSFLLILATVCLCLCWCVSPSLQGSWWSVAPFTRSKRRSAPTYANSSAHIPLDRPVKSTPFFPWLAWCFPLSSIS